MSRKIRKSCSTSTEGEHLNTQVFFFLLFTADILTYQGEWKDTGVTDIIREDRVQPTHVKHRGSGTYISLFTPAQCQNVCCERKDVPSSERERQIISVMVRPRLICHWSLCSKRVWNRTWSHVSTTRDRKGTHSVERCSDFFSHIFLAYGFDKNITMIRVFFFSCSW